MKSFSSPKKRFSRPRRSAAPAAHTSWNKVADWYTDHLKERGDYQEDLIFPGALKLLEARAGGTYIDLACGEGSFLQGLVRQIRRGTLIGIDAAPKLISHAQQQLRPTKDLRIETIVGDVSKPQSALKGIQADGITCLMAIQNIEDIVGVFRLAAATLKANGQFLIVMNHPCFRQPRQSGWGWDEGRKLQYRRIDRYKSGYEMPIIAHPGAAPSVSTLSYHRPLETYINALGEAGLAVNRLEEWSSKKISTSGPRAKAENTAREEIPLFLAIRAQRITH
jgi:SAM-dependent methyltransferase